MPVWQVELASPRPVGVLRRSRRDLAAIVAERSAPIMRTYISPGRSKESQPLCELAVNELLEPSDIKVPFGLTIRTPLKLDAPFVTFSDAPPSMTKSFVELTLRTV
jgi:hypothetical protein